MAKPSPRSQAVLVAAFREGLGPRAAARLSDAELREAALAAAARVDAEVARLQRSGEFKSVNRAYRAYRLQACARGERIAPYAAWLARYKADRIREIAAALR